LTSAAGTAGAAAVRESSRADSAANWVVSSVTWIRREEREGLDISERRDVEVCVAGAKVTLSNIQHINFFIWGVI
jgi:hypothetical protein